MVVDPPNGEDQGAEEAQSEEAAPDEAAPQEQPKDKLKRALKGFLR